MISEREIILITNFLLSDISLLSSLGNLPFNILFIKLMHTTQEYTSKTQYTVSFFDTITHDRMNSVNLFLITFTERICMRHKRKDRTLTSLNCKKCKKRF